MAVTKKEADGEHPSSHYLSVPDPAKPSTWGLRVYGTDGQPDHRLMGAAWAALTVGYRGNTYEGPDKAQCLARLKALYRREKMPLPGGAQMAEDTVIDLADVATFALTAEETDGDEDVAVVRRTGLIFRAGDYRPRRDFAITPDELRHVAETFAGPVDAELEHHQSSHIRSFLDGKIGQLVAVWTNDDGTELFGDVEVPRFIDKHWSAVGHKVSTVWDTTVDGMKYLASIGLVGVLNPVVPDAQLFADYVAFAGQRHSASDVRDIQQMHDLSHEMHSMALKQGAGCPDPAQMVPGTPASGQSPTFAQEHDHKGDAQMPDEKTPPTDAVSPVQFAELQTAFAEMKASMEGEVTALKAKNTELETKNQTLFSSYAEERSRRVQSEATAFADAQVAALKAWPHQRDSLIMRYVVAVNDDANHGLITFGEGNETSRQQLLIDEFAKVEPHKMTQEQVRVLEATPGAAQLFGLPNPQQTPGAAAGSGTAGQPRQDVLDQLLASSTPGQQILAERKKNGASAS